MLKCLAGTVRHPRRCFWRPSKGTPGIVRRLLSAKASAYHMKELADTVPCRGVPVLVVSAHGGHLAWTLAARLKHTHRAKFPPAAARPRCCRPPTPTHGARGVRGQGGCGGGHAEQGRRIDAAARRRGGQPHCRRPSTACAQVRARRTEVGTCGRVHGGLRPWLRGRAGAQGAVRALLDARAAKGSVSTW